MPTPKAPNPVTARNTALRLAMVPGLPLGIPLGLPLGLALGLAVPAVARGNEQTVTLGPHAVVPIGPPRPGIQIRRMLVQGRRYVTVSAPATSTMSRCGAPLQRVTVWEQLPDRTWFESLSDTYDTCIRASEEQRTVSVSVVNGPEAHVLLQAPHTPPALGTLVRYLRSGDRFIGPHREGPMAAAPFEGPRGVLAEAPRGAVDGDLTEWQGREPMVSSQGVRVWLGAQGRSVRFAAHLPPGIDPALTLVLAPQGISTDILHGNVDDHGRFLAVRCGSPAPSDAEVRCRPGAGSAGGTDVEGSTDLGTMVWAGTTVSTVTAYAQVGVGTSRIASDPNYRLHPYTLPAPLDLMAGTTARTRALCADARFRTWSPLPGMQGPGVLSCGARCTGRDCERLVLTEDVPRLSLVRDGQSFCASVTGPGSERVHTCSAGGDPARLVGVFPLPGFSTVIALDRETPQGDSAGRRAEVWALVSPSAAWQRLWQGAERPSSEGARVDSLRLHPRFCTGENSCEVAEAVTLAPPEPSGPVTAGISRLGLTAGLRQPPRF